MALWVTDEQFSEFMEVNRESDPYDDEWLSMANAAAHAGIRTATGRDLTYVDPDDLPDPVDRRCKIRGLGPVLRIPDCVTVTAVAGVEFDPTRFQLEPLDNLAPNGEWRPYTQIRIGRHTTIRGDHFGNITVTLVPGWTVIPPGAYTAVLTLAKDIALSKDIKFGLAAITEYAGVAARQNPEVWRQISGFARAESMMIL
jgi:hypothetical protein